MRLLLTCVQKRNEHSTFQANPNGFGGGCICSPIQGKPLAGGRKGSNSKAKGPKESSSGPFGTEHDAAISQP